MKQYLHTDKGFISLYFLAVLLYISEISLLIMTCDTYRMKTIMNLKKNQKYMIQETKIIKEVRSRLKDPELEMLNIESYDCELILNERMIRIYVNSSEPEYIDLYVDEMFEEVLSYESYRLNVCENE